MSSEHDKTLVCNCQRTMTVDGAALATALGCDALLRVHSELCRAELSSFQEALGGEGRVHVACTQEAALFREVAAERGVEEGRLRFSNIRERAGWSRGNAAAEVAAKMSALLAEAAFETKPAGALSLKSEGICLVYGRGQQALDVANDLSGRLGVTLLLSDADDIVPPARWNVPVFKGRVRRLSGHLGAFEVEVDGYAQLVPSSRAALEFAMPRNGARSKCDIVIDLSGGEPLLREHARRDGYIHVAQANPVAVAKAMLAATDLVGEFEKPLYVSYDQAICAHARSGIVGCSRCVDSCPLGVIQPDGDGVAIDHAACGGCGACSAVCPTGAVSYAYPSRKDLVTRGRLLIETFTKAGGSTPVLLLHEDRHGSELISAMARYGRGLPSNVMPMAVHSVTEVGHETLAALLALGASRIALLVPPEKRDELDPLAAQVALTEAVLSGLGHEGDRLQVIEEVDPDAVDQALWDQDRIAAPAAATFLAQEGKRETARLAFTALHAAAPTPTDAIVLPKGAPYGRIAVDEQGCTLCLSCVGACPANALGDNPDRPELNFTEAACVQCGICVATCPEKVIRLEPRLDFTQAALAPRTIKSEEPFECIRCGKPFGAKSSIERVMERLKGHAMFQDGGQLEVIQMCEDCRVIAMSERSEDPMRLGTRPRIVTTDDYLEADKTASERGAGNGASPGRPRKPEDFIGE